MSPPAGEQAVEATPGLLHLPPGLGRLLPWGVGLLGLLISLNWVLLHPITSLFPGFTDSRLNMYLLEHSWHWITGQAPEGLWNPPFFYPIQNTRFFGNLLIGFAPLYWVGRAAGLGSPQAFTLWVLLHSVVNYALAYFFLHRCLKTSPAASSLGAWIIAYGCSRFVRMYHAQLMPLLFVLGMFIAIWRYFAMLNQAVPEGMAEPAAWRRRKWIALFYACLVGQLYSEFYMAWFTGFILAILGFWALWFPSHWPLLWKSLRRDAWVAAIAAAMAAVAVWPITRGYLEVMQYAGRRDWLSVAPMVPRWRSWLYVTEFSPFYLWESYQRLFDPAVLPVRHEHTLGIGFLTTLVGTWGVLTHWRRRPVLLVLLVTASVLLLVHYYGDHASPWRFFMANLPGATAIRAVGRIGLLLPIAAAMGMAMLIDTARTRQALGLVLVIAGICCVEQIIFPPFEPLEKNQPWVDQIAGQVDRTKKAFVVSMIERGNHVPLDAMVLHVDAMLASQATGVPTLNGFDGVFPPDWPRPIYMANTDDDSRRAAYRAGIATWAAAHGMRPEEIQWIELPATYRPR